MLTYAEEAIDPAIARPRTRVRYVGDVEETDHASLCDNSDDADTTGRRLVRDRRQRDNDSDGCCFSNDTNPTQCEIQGYLANDGWSDDLPIVDMEPGR